MAISPNTSRKSVVQEQGGGQGKGSSSVHRDPLPSGVQEIGRGRVTFVKLRVAKGGFPGERPFPTGSGWASGEYQRAPDLPAARALAYHGRQPPLMEMRTNGG